jgi:sugar-specific transcriptional regulator TrmB
LDDIRDLIAIGFTEYEARVYLALLRDNPATGYQLSKGAGIPRSMVYEALGRLHARGAVLKTGDYRGALYRPVSPEALLDRYEGEQRILLRNLRENLHRIHSDRTEERLWSISGRNNVLAYVQQMIDSAGEEILLVLSDAHLAVLSDKIRAVCDSGITTKALLTGSGSLDCGNVIHHPPLESELQQLDDMLVVVVDGNECLISSGDLDMEATITTNRNLVLITRQFIWMEFFAQRIYSRLGEDLLEILDPEDRRIYSTMPPE